MLGLADNVRGEPTVLAAPGQESLNHGKPSKPGRKDTQDLQNHVGSHTCPQNTIRFLTGLVTPEPIHGRQTGGSTEGRTAGAWRDRQQEHGRTGGSTEGWTAGAWRDSREHQGTAGSTEGKGPCCLSLWFVPGLGDSGGK